VKVALLRGTGSFGQAMAKRLVEANVSGDAARLMLGFRTCVMREPTAAETGDFSALLSRAQAYYAAHADEAKLAVGNHAPANVSAQEAAAWVATVRVLLNLDEFITRE